MENDCVFNKHGGLAGISEAISPFDILEAGMGEFLAEPAESVKDLAVVADVAGP
jgi:hypothetical protein